MLVFIISFSQKSSILLDSFVRITIHYSTPRRESQFPEINIILVFIQIHTYKIKISRESLCNLYHFLQMLRFFRLNLGQKTWFCVIQHTPIQIAGTKLYTLLTFRANNTDITSIEFSISEKSEDKELIPAVGQMEGNIWVGEAREVVFTLTYTSSWPESNANKHIQISGVKITVAAPSGITQHTSDPKSQTSTIYDLQGRRVAQPTKGMYIKNERKFIVK